MDVERSCVVYKVHVLMAFPTFPLCCISGPRDYGSRDEPSELHMLVATLKFNLGFDYSCNHASLTLTSSLSQANATEQQAV